jgi:hypothetical protein
MLLPIDSIEKSKCGVFSGTPELPHCVLIVAERVTKDHIAVRNSSKLLSQSKQSI